MTKSYKAKHILLDDEEDAFEIIQMLKDGASFEELAKEYSECDSANKGGDLGSFRSGSMLPEFERGIYQLKVGEISKPVKTKFGYHIILRVE